MNEHDKYYLYADEGKIKEILTEAGVDLNEIPLSKIISLLQYKWKYESTTTYITNYIINRMLNINKEEKEKINKIKSRIEEALNIRTYEKDAENKVTIYIDCDTTNLISDLIKYTNDISQKVWEEITEEMLEYCIKKIIDQKHGLEYIVITGADFLIKQLRIRNIKIKNSEALYRKLCELLSMYIFKENDENAKNKFTLYNIGEISERSEWKDEN